MLGSHAEWVKTAGWFYDRSPIHQFSDCSLSLVSLHDRLSAPKELAVSVSSCTIKFSLVSRYPYFFLFFFLLSLVARRKKHSIGFTCLLVRLHIGYHVSPTVTAHLRRTLAFAVLEPNAENHITLHRVTSPRSRSCASQRQGTQNLTYQPQSTALRGIRRARANHHVHHHVHLYRIKGPAQGATCKPSSRASPATHTKEIRLS